MAGDSQLATFATIPNNTAKQWWKDAGLRWNVFYGLGCMLCPYYLGYDQSLLNGLQSLPQWTSFFNNPHGTKLGLISAAMFLPAVVFSWPAAYMCDHWGHRSCIFFGCVFIIAGGIWNALCMNEIQYIISRVVIGIGGAVTKVAAPAYLQEIAHPRLRANMGSMYYGFYYLGSVISAIMCIIGLEIKGSWGWRFPTVFMIFGPIVVCAILASAPESPRFLVKHERHEEAMDMLAKYHANGDRHDHLVQWEFNEIQYSIEQELVSNKSSYLDFFKTRGNRKRLWVSLTIGLGVNWVGNGIVSYYLTPVLKSVGVKSPKELVSFNAGIAAWNLIIAEVAGLYADRFGRRPLFLVSTIGMILSYTFVMGFSAGFAKTGAHNLGIAAIPFLFLFFGSYDIAWTTMNYSYCAEIMPYNLRTKGLAIYLCVQQAGNAFNQFVNPIALAAITWKYYAVYIAIDCALVVVIYLFFPETKKLTIEEISLVFDYGTKEGRKMAAAALHDVGGEPESDGEGKDTTRQVEVVSK